MKVQTSTLRGNALAYAVFAALGRSYWTAAGARWDSNEGYTDWILDARDGALRRFTFDGSCSRAGAWVANEVWRPHCDWEQGGPIKSAAHVSTVYDSTRGVWVAAVYAEVPDDPREFDGNARAESPEELEAAMRSLVMYRMGTEILLPVELR